MIFIIHLLTFMIFILKILSVMIFKQKFGVLWVVWGDKEQQYSKQRTKVALPLKSINILNALKH